VIEDDDLRFGLAVELVILADLLTNVVAVERAVYALVTTPALALEDAFTASAASASPGFGPFLPWVAAFCTVAGLEILWRWRWSEA